MTDPSSITSVTEEDSDESDTTETSCSKTIDSVSSVLYSSECNTDDKLSNSLTNFSISKNENAHASSSNKRLRKYEQLDNDYNDSGTTSDPFPHDCRPLPLDRTKQKITHVKKKQKNFHSTALTRYVLQKRLMLKPKSSSLPKQEEENFGVDDPNNYLYTDFSDTSSIPRLNNNSNEDLNSNDDGDFGSDSNGNNDRPFFPNMNSESWFQAKCFDQYWSHYSFVMEWYRQHVSAVNVLSAQFAQPHALAQVLHQNHQAKPKKKNKAKRAKNRARNRRLAKARQRASRAKLLNESDTQDSDSNVDESELEMEITDDMMDFFAKSFKHRMERDHGKTDDNGDSKSKDGKPITDGPHSSKDTFLLGPKEQPGIRRTTEMKILYGQGAAMIHGMETALQMTYDKVLDRHKPKLWPNMPLRITFSK